MKAVFMILALAAAISGCAQTSLLRSPSDSQVSATVEDPILPGEAQITVVFGGKAYSGVEGDSHEDTTGEQALRFGWNPASQCPTFRRGA